MLKNLCDSCTNFGCGFQSDIIRTKCDFYKPPVAQQKPCVNIPFLLHKETGCPLYECVEAYEKAYEYLRSKAKIIG